MPYDTNALLALCRPTRLKFDHIGIRTLRSRDPLCWPSRGWVKMPATDFGHYSACPKFTGDGVCAALTVNGAASGGYSLAEGILIVGWCSAHVAGSTSYKVRLSAAFVLGAAPLSAVLPALVGDLTGADLTRANLTGADLTGANLTGADLTGADLTGADLAGANLTRANLTGADLAGANLTRANLAGANLTRANLTGADLAGANLTRANLAGAVGHTPGK